MKTEIELAKQAGWEYADDDRGFEPLWRFAELVRADERAQRTWVGLTDEEYGSMYNTHLRNGGPIQNLTRAIEAKLKEKNA